MNLPRFEPDEPISAAKMNLLRDELIRLAKLTVTAPLELSDDESGRNIGLSEEVAVRYARVVSIIEAFDPATGTLGSGTAQLQTPDDDDVLQDDDDDPVTVKNDVNRVAPVDAQIKVIRMGSDWAIFTASCGS